MRITQIVASVTSNADYPHRDFGKETFLSLTAIPDIGTWTLEEAEINYFVLCEKISKLTLINMQVRGMVGKEEVVKRMQGMAGSYKQIIDKLSVKDQK
jgi:hypothetical protein